MDPLRSSRIFSGEIVYVFAEDLVNGRVTLVTLFRAETGLLYPSKPLKWHNDALEFQYCGTSEVFVAPAHPE